MAKRQGSTAVADGVVLDVATQALCKVRGLPLAFLGWHELRVRVARVCRAWRTLSYGATVLAHQAQALSLGMDRDGQSQLLRQLCSGQHGWCHLRRLYFNSTPNLTAASMLTIARACPRLRALTILYCASFACAHADWLRATTSHLAQLETLQLRQWDVASAHSVRALAQLTNLRAVSLGCAGSAAPDESGLCHLFDGAHWPRLELLALSSWELSESARSAASLDRIWRAWSTLSELRVLALDYTPHLLAEPAALAHLERLPKLRSLQLEEPEGVTDDTLQRIGRHCRHLTELQVDNGVFTASFTAAGLQHLVPLRQLERLSLNRMNEESRGGVLDWSVGFRHLARLPRLRWLSIEYSRCTAHALVEALCLLPPLVSLRGLDLFSVDLGAGADDLGPLYAALKGLPSLELVRVSTVDEIATLTAMASLEGRALRFINMFGEGWLSFVVSAYLDHAPFACG